MKKSRKAGKTARVPRYLSSHTIEQNSKVSRLSEYYSLDEKNKVFEIPLHYEKASDLFIGNVEYLDKPKISDETTNSMAEMLDDIPEGYKADFSVTIDDYQDIPSSKILQGIIDALTFRHLRFVQENTRKGIKVGLLMFIGASFILLKTYGIIFDWWGDGTVNSDMLTYILDIFGCVLIWESVYALFVDRSEEIDFERAISRKVHSIRLYDENNEGILAQEDSRNIMSIMSRNKRKLVSNHMLLLSGFSLLALAVSDLLTMVSILVNRTGIPEDAPGIYITVYLLAGTLSVLILCSVASTAINIYRGKNVNNIRSAAKTVLMIILLLVDILVFDFKTREDTIQQIFKIVAETAFVTGLILRFSYFLNINRSYREKTGR